jgi:hypothetical protein
MDRVMSYGTYLPAWVQASQDLSLLPIKCCGQAYDDSYAGALLDQEQLQKYRCGLRRSHEGTTDGASWVCFIQAPAVLATAQSLA